MKLLIDDAHIEEIRKICDQYPIDGVTTNPSILAKTGKDPQETLTEIRDFIGPNALFFVQAIPVTSEGMVEDAKAIVENFGPNTIVKIPAIPEGFKALRILKKEGITTCATIVYTPMQALLAAKAGASYVAPYVNRIDNLGYDGVKVSKEIYDILKIHRLSCGVLAASFRNSQQILDLCRYGIEAVTAAPAVIRDLVNNPAIDSAVKDFSEDFDKLAGKGKTMADILKQE